MMYGLFGNVGRESVRAPNHPNARTEAPPGKCAQSRCVRAVEELNEHIAYFKTHYLGGKNAPAAYDEEEEDYTGTDGADAPGSNAGNSSGTGSDDGETDGPTDVTEVTD